MIPAFKIQNCEIITIEGFAQTDNYQDIINGFSEAQIETCGFCDSGKILTAEALLDKTEEPEKEKILSAFDIKIIALIGMFLDHTAKVLLPVTGEPVSLRAVMVWIGRLAFPLFAFLIAEGCRKTRSMPKYIGRLVLFAVFSHIAFYLAFNLPRGAAGSAFAYVGEAAKAMLYLKVDNVFTTFALAASAIYVWTLIERRTGSALWSLSLFPLCAAILAADYCSSDYNIYGVMLVFVLYLLPTRKLQLSALFLWCCVFYLGHAAHWSAARLLYSGTWITWGFACLSVPLLYFYNNARGRNLKWAFYIAYPAHLLILVILREILVIINQL
jgi:hypothetical protein